MSSPAAIFNIFERPKLSCLLLIFIGLLLPNLDGHTSAQFDLTYPFNLIAKIIYHPSIVYITFIHCFQKLSPCLFS